MRGKSLPELLWRIGFPILLYFSLSISLTGILEIVCPPLGEPENAMWLLTAGNALQIPIYLWLYIRERDFGEISAKDKPVWKRSFGLTELFWAALGGLFLSRGFNGLIGLTPLPGLFPGYEAVSSAVYGGSLLSQVMASVVTASVLEETLMRGLVYGRIRESGVGVKPAMLAGALLFALFHGNVVQGVYAFLMGLFFVWVYEAYQALTPAIIAHAAANASSILLERTGWLDRLYEGLPLYLVTTALCLLAGGFCWSRIRGKNCAWRA